VFKNDGGHLNDFSDESSVVLDADFDSDNDKKGSIEEDPSELFDAKIFSKHGFDFLLI